MISWAYDSHMNDESCLKSDRFMIKTTLLIQWQRVMQIILFRYSLTRTILYCVLKNGLREMIKRKNSYKKWKALGGGL